MLPYWEEMNHKYGFCDGAEVPPDAVAIRAVSVRIVNALLEKLGSKCRVVAFNCPGTHNPIMLLRVPVQYTVGKSEEEITGGKIEYVEEVPPDEEWEAAIALAENTIDIDSLVETKVTTDEQAVAQLLASMKAKDTGVMLKEAMEHLI